VINHGVLADEQQHRNHDAEHCGKFENEPPHFLNCISIIGRRAVGAIPGSFAITFLFQPHRMPFQQLTRSSNPRQKPDPPMNQLTTAAKRQVASICSMPVRLAIWVKTQSGGVSV